ncbi:hypothetical protein [Flavobacterium sp.]|uniref:hypothetical protein n=1 Tax=Flavobacterium sp. TaxID=239 RepID=UPI0031D9D876
MDSYYDTANRMYKSAQLLHTNQEFHNSCYVGGYVIECYVKIIYQLMSGSNPPHSHNISNINSQCLQYIANGNASNQAYFVDSNTNFGNVLSRWNPVNSRYIETANEFIEIDSQNFQNEIQTAMTEIARMKVDGLTLI